MKIQLNMKFSTNSLPEHKLRANHMIEWVEDNRSEQDLAIKQSSRLFLYRKLTKLEEQCEIQDKISP